MPESIIYSVSHSGLPQIGDSLTLAGEGSLSRAITVNKGGPSQPLTYLSSAVWEAYHLGAIRISPNPEIASGGSSPSAMSTWDIEASPSLPAEAVASSLFEVQGVGVYTNLDSSLVRFEDGDVAQVLLDGVSVVNLSYKNAVEAAQDFAAFDETSELLKGTLSNNNLTFSMTSSGWTQLDSVGNNNLSQAEYTVTTLSAAIYFMVLDSTTSTASILSTGSGNSIFAAHINGSWLIYVGSPALAIGTLTGLPSLVPGDKVTIGVDHTTRQVRVNVNGVEGTLSTSIVPGSGLLTHGLGAESGTLLATINTGPTFTNSFPSYVGVYDLISSFKGTLRIAGANWNPGTGFPMYATLVPGDVWYANADGAIAGKTYYAGQGIYYDGLTWHKLNADTPFTKDGLLYNGSLVITSYTTASSSHGSMLGTTQEGYSYLVSADAYENVTTPQGSNDLFRVFPKNSLVAVRNSRWELLSYPPNPYNAEVEYKFPVSEATALNFVDHQQSPIMAQSDTIGMFEYKVTANTERTSGIDAFGVFLPTNVGSGEVVDVTAMVANATWQCNVGVDLVAKTIFVKYFDGETAVTDVLHSWAADAPSAVGDVWTILAFSSASTIRVYRNGVNLVIYDINANIFINTGIYEYSWAPFRFTTNNSQVNARLTANSGQLPFAYNRYGNVGTEYPVYTQAKLPVIYSPGSQVDPTNEGSVVIAATTTSLDFTGGALSANKLIHCAEIKDGETVFVHSTNGITSITLAGAGLTFTGNLTTLGAGGSGTLTRTGSVVHGVRALNPVQTNQTGVRALNTTYTAGNRPIMVQATVRCAVTIAGGVATVQGKSDGATPPLTIASGSVGLESGLLGEDNTFQITFTVAAGANYRIDSALTNGTATLGEWFEIAL